MQYEDINSTEVRQHWIGIGEQEMVTVKLRGWVKKKIWKSILYKTNDNPKLFDNLIYSKLYVKEQIISLKNTEGRLLEKWRGNMWEIRCVPMCILQWRAHYLQLKQDSIRKEIIEKIKIVNHYINRMLRDPDPYINMSNSHHVYLSV